MAEGLKTVAGAVKSAVPQVAQRPVPAGYGLAYQMGGPNYMYGVTPRFGAYYRDDGRTPVPGQIYGNMPGSREGADMFGFWPTMFQSSPYATASQMYTPGLGVMPLIGYPSRYPHVIMGGYTDYGAGIGNQAMGMMLPLLMMGLYRQMFPMPGMPGAAGGRGGAGGSGGGNKGGSSGGIPAEGASSGGTPAAVPDNSPYAYVYPDWATGRKYDEATGTGGGLGMGTLGPTPAFVTRRDGSIDLEHSASPELLSRYYNHRDTAFVGPVRRYNDFPNVDMAAAHARGGVGSSRIEFTPKPTALEVATVQGASDMPIPLQNLK